MTYVTANVPNTIIIPHITEHEITVVISSMKHSSPGWDSLPTHILKSRGAKQGGGWGGLNPH